MTTTSATRKFLTMLAVFIAAVLPASAEEWSKTYSVTANPDLRIETTDANIRVNTWDQNTIEARVITNHYKIGEGGIRVEEHQTGNSVGIEVRYPRHNFNFEWGPSHRVDIIVQMPRQGNVNLRTGDGKIELADLKGTMNLHSGDGSESLENLDGKLHASTGDGHIRANGRFDELELKTGDGHLEAIARTGSTMAANWRLESGDGGISLELPPDLAADVDLHTGDGHIDLDMPLTTEGKIRTNEIHGKLNGGGSLLTIHTGDGSIHLRKS
jgi:DUF4097 and DUF4098 domain-containing protein YvlB